MDDFLHNLRSGKLKQHDRSSRPYNDPQYKGGHRRGAVDRRKKDLETFERLNAVKEVLESISETQKRMAEAYEARIKAEDRKARAMEVLAMNIYRMINPEAKDADMLFATAEAPVAIAPAEKSDEPVAAPESPAVEQTPSKLSDEDRHVLCKLIGKLRDDGYNWEKIAREIASQGYPTISGKGTWRGVMAKNLYEKQLSQ